MNIDEKLDIIAYYVLYIPFNVLAIILAIPMVCIFIPYTYFTNYHEFNMIFSFPNILIAYYIFYKIISDSMFKLIK
jgi:hypothetical protein